MKCVLAQISLSAIDFSLNAHMVTFDSNSVRFAQTAAIVMSLTPLRLAFQKATGDQACAVTAGRSLDTQILAIELDIMIHA